MGMEQLIDIFKALLTPVIGGVAVYIAWQQWRTNKQRLKIELFDRRWEVYQEFRKILSMILRDGGVKDEEDIIRFRSSVAGADFLFRPEIREYIDEIYNKSMQVWVCAEKLKGSSSLTKDTCKELINEKCEAFDWLRNQITTGSGKSDTPLREKFRKYLDIQ